MTDTIVDWDPVVFIHTYTNKGIGRSILLSIRAILLVSLERVDALGVDFLDLILRYVFQVVARRVVLPLLRVRFVVVLLDQIVAQFDLL